MSDDRDPKKRDAGGDDEARRHILARRAKFVAVALGTAGLATTACGPRTCLDIDDRRDGEVPATPSADAGAATGSSAATSGTASAGPDTAASPSAGEPDAGAPPGASATGSAPADAGAPRPCLKLPLPPTVCLKIKPPPTATGG
ncbi:MAG: hypothetical protein HY908_25795 [Myxococcales bacterium]|nr:hypothetical protein [Myxococcales bacterium]